MRLLIDLGNSRLKWALADADGIVRQGAFAHHGTDIAQALDREWPARPRVDGVHVASVAATALDADIDDWLLAHFGVRGEFVRSPAAALGIRNAYAEPARLGVDRFLGLAALHAAAPRAQVLIGVGTAMTLDALDDDGTHLGGWILPSPALMRDAVLARTARVGVADGDVVDFAASTADALRSGSINAACGAVDRFCANAARRFGRWPALALTGGGADEIAPFLPGVVREHDLVLRGLALWANAAESPDFDRGGR